MLILSTVRAGESSCKQLLLLPFQMSMINYGISCLTSHPLITTLAAACAGIFLALKMRSKEKNPFEHDTRKPPKPLETDQSKRDAVLKQGFLPKKVPSNLDAIVIGSGIGGLATANILARTGKHDVCSGNIQLSIEQTGTPRKVSKYE